MNEELAIYLLNDAQERLELEKETDNNEYFIQYLRGQIFVLTEILRK